MGLEGLSKLRKSSSTLGSGFQTEELPPSTQPTGATQWEVSSTRTKPTKPVENKTQPVRVEPTKPTIEPRLQRIDLLISKVEATSTQQRLSDPDLDYLCKLLQSDKTLEGKRRTVQELEALLGEELSY